MLQGVLTAAGPIRQSIKRFVSLLMQYKVLVKNISLVYLHRYNWSSADREEENKHELKAKIRVGTRRR